MALVAPVLVATTEVGAPGTVASVVTELDAVEYTEAPKLFLAVTVNVYAVPGDKPPIVIVPLPAWDSVPSRFPGLEMAVYAVIVSPPLYKGAV